MKGIGYACNIQNLQTLEITWNQQNMCKTHPTGTSKPPFYSSKNTWRRCHFLRLGQDNLLRQWKCLCQPLCRWCSVSPQGRLWNMTKSSWIQEKIFPTTGEIWWKYDPLQPVIIIDVAIKIRILGIHSIGDPYFQSMRYCFFFLSAHVEVIY